MKKLYSLILLLVTSLLLVGCQSPTDDLPKDYYTQDELDILLQEKIDSIEIVDYSYLDDEILLLETYISQLQLQLEEQQLEIDDLQLRLSKLETDFGNLGYFEGLNGQRKYYVVDTEASTMKMSNIYLANDLDKTKLPSYLFDLDGNNVSFSDLTSKLKLKYFLVDTLSYEYDYVGAKTNISITVGDLYSKEEIAVRSVLMLEELSNYDYWLIGSSEIYLSVYGNNEYHSFYIYMPSFRSDGFNLTLEDYYYNDWEISTDFTFDLEIAQALYDQYVLEDKFIGYVLELE